MADAGPASKGAESESSALNDYSFSYKSKRQASAKRPEEKRPNLRETSKNSDKQEDKLGESEPAVVPGGSADTYTSGSKRSSRSSSPSLFEKNVPVVLGKRSSSVTDCDKSGRSKPKTRAAAQASKTSGERDTAKSQKISCSLSSVLDTDPECLQSSGLSAKDKISKKNRRTKSLEVLLGADARPEKQIKTSQEVKKVQKKSSRLSASDSTLVTETASSASVFVDATKAQGNTRKRKKESPQFSPKRLRSSSSLPSISSKLELTTPFSEPELVTDQKQKTGNRSTRHRSPAERDSTQPASSDLGSCSSSRRRRRPRAPHPVPSAMESIGGHVAEDALASSPATSTQPSSASGESVLGAVAAVTGAGAVSSTSQDSDGNTLEEADMTRLQALLEARGLPAHLFGSLGPRMHLLLHRTFNSGAGMKAQQLLTFMQSEDEGTQLQGVMEMCQLLVMGNEETLGGFPVKQVVPVLITLLQMEHNFDIMNHACRALTYLMEALPRSSTVVIEAIPAFLEKLQAITCMDVAEQSLTALEMLSRRHGKAILQAGGLGAALMFLDFFSILAQRSALAIAANCCHSVSVDEFQFVKDSIPILSGRLTNQDKKSIESVCLAFARLVDNFQKDEKLIRELCVHDLLANVKQLLVVSPAIITSGTFVMVIHMLSVMCASCPSIAVELLRQNVSETLRYLLIGTNSAPADEIVELVPRSPQELYELTCLVSELLPALPVSGVFSVDILLNKGTQHTTQVGTWQWKDDRGTWHNYLWVDNRILEAAYQSGEDEINLSTLGRNYIIDFANSQQINEDTGTIRSIRRKTGPGQNSVVTTVKTKEKTEDERSVIFRNEAELGIRLVESLMAVIYDVYYSSVGPAVKHKCLNSILKMLYHSPDELLVKVLKSIPVSSYIAGMLSSQDVRIVCSSLQKVDILMSKLASTFHIYFRREGVMYKVKCLCDSDTTPFSTPQSVCSMSLFADHAKSTSTEGSPSLLSIQNYSDASPGLDEDVLELSSSLPARRSSESLKSKKRVMKKLSRQRSSKSSVAESSPPAPSKKLSHEPAIARSSSYPTPVGTPTTSAGPSKSSFFTSFTPRWGRSQSYQNTAGGTPTEKSLKERFVKDQEQNKEKIKTWIKEQAQRLYDTYFSENTGKSHPALCVLRRLTVAAETLNVETDFEIGPLNDVCDVLQDSSDAGASPFEIVHSGIVKQLLRYITFDGGKKSVPRSVRIKRFLATFLRSSNGDEISVSTGHASKPPFVALVQKLNLCINQLEQFPVKCHDIPGAGVVNGARGTSALRFFNTHQIKCNLQRHPDCVALKQWSGGPVKIDPLALVQAIERYLVVRGYGKLREGADEDLSDDDDHSDDEIEESLASQLQGSTVPKHFLEFVLNGQVLAYNMTVYQAVQQHAQGNYNEDNETDDDSGPFGRASIWTETHTIYYRPVSASKDLAGGTSSRSSSKSELTSAKAAVKSKSGDQGKTPEAADFLCESLPSKFSLSDPSLEVICLMRVLYHLNKNWGSYLGLPFTRAVVSVSEFLNSKLTAKAWRQLQDPLVIMTGNLPSWLSELAKACPFFLPFECRQQLFYSTSFDRDRAVMKLQETIPDLATSDSSDRVTPRLDKKKRTVSRGDLLNQAETVIAEFANSKALLEIQYEGEVGSGLGPTLEFYALVSKEFQKADLSIWSGDEVEVTEGEGDSKYAVKYVQSSAGLYPAAIPKSVKANQLVKLKNKFRFLGTFVAKACMDSRIIDIPLSQLFYKWLLGQESTIDIADMEHVDPIVHKSLSQLYDVVLRKRQIEADPSHSEESMRMALSSLNMGGLSIEDLGLDFVLPGTSIELKKNGKDLPVTIDNLEEYIKLVVHMRLVEGVSRQFAAFKKGFESFFPLSSLQMFYPEEMDLLLCGSRSEKWDTKELMDCCRPDHGYTHDSRAVGFLFEILSKYGADEQRMFLQFITGSPKLPVGGFRSLNPPLTIVRKATDSSANPDNYLPSVMTCVNYLKLPDYSNIDVMAERLKSAYQEGRNAFHLS